MVDLIDKLIFKPQVLNKNNNKLIKDLKTSLKKYYNIGKGFDSKETSLKKLIIKKCDDEQIWGQLYLNANFFLKKNTISKCYKKMGCRLISGKEEESLQASQKGKNILAKKKILYEQKKRYITGKLSSFEQKQEMMNERINKLERQNLFGQTWQLMGEVDAKTIPDDELIVQKLKFESCDKFKQKIILENIEKTIKKRIMEKNFDDVSIKKTLRRKKQQKEVVDKKSKYSLDELHQDSKLDDTKQIIFKTENKKKLDEYKDIMKLKVELFHQLDSITNFYFTRSVSRNDDDKNIEFKQQKVY